MNTVASAVSLTALAGTMVRSTPAAVNWRPQFLATVKNDGGVAVAGAWVQAVLQVHSGARVVGLQNLMCQTGTSGQCPMAWSGPVLKATHTGAQLQVLAVTGNYRSYRPGRLTVATVGQVR